MTSKQRVAAGITAVMAAVAIVLLVYGTGEQGLRVAIRTTARTSAICIALAFARVAAREALIVLPFSHALHYAAILTLAAMTSASNAHIGATSIGGAAIFALMVATAVRPTTIGIYALWLIFIIGFVVRDMTQPVYPAIMVLLVAAGIVRAARRDMATTQRA
jgi:hypothetical protein